MHYCMHILLFKAMSFNYFVNNWRNISNIVLKSDFDVLFVYSFENKKRYYIVITLKNDNKMQIIKFMFCKFNSITIDVEFKTFLNISN